MIHVENHKIYQLNDLSNTENVNRLKDAMASIPVENFRGMEQNYVYEHKDTPGNLFCILDEGRYLNGAYYILTDKDDNFMAASGWYMYQDETEGEVALALTRTIIHPNSNADLHFQLTKNHNRGLLPDFLLDIGVIRNYMFLPIIAEIKTKHQGKIWQTVNEKNYGFVWLLNRESKKENSTYYKVLDDTGVKYRWIPAGKRIVHYTMQHILELQKID